MRSVPASRRRRARIGLSSISSAIFGKRPDGTEVCVTSETIFHMANAVAEAVGKKYPNVLIGVFAYSGYAHPPSFDLEPEHLCGGHFALSPHAAFL